MIGYVCGITHKILYSNDSLDEDDPVAQNMNRLAVFKDLRCNPNISRHMGGCAVSRDGTGREKRPLSEVSAAVSAGADRRADQP